MYFKDDNDIKCELSLNNCHTLSVSNVSRTNLPDIDLCRSLTFYTLQVKCVSFHLIPCGMSTNMLTGKKTVCVLVNSLCRYKPLSVRLCMDLQRTGKLNHIQCEDKTAGKKINMSLSLLEMFVISIVEFKVDQR